MKLYVCWGTFPAPWRPGGHPCRNAYNALREAGWEPEVVRSYGLTVLPDNPFNQTEGRKEAKRLTGKSTVPVLVTDDGEVIADSRKIAEWASDNPASGAERTASGA
jgi:glutathione S-transferase